MRLGSKPYPREPKGHFVSDDQQARPGSVEFYRERAGELFKQAEHATSEEARVSFLALAEHWLRLARTVENPSW